MSSRSLKIATFFYPFGLTPDGGVYCYDLLKIFTEGSHMAKVLNDVETLPKISVA